MASNEHKWFTNIGQVLQIIIAALALVVAGRNAWNELMASHYLSWGAILFYVLVGLVILWFWWMVRNKQPRALDPDIESELARLNPYERFAFNQVLLTGGMTAPQFAQRMQEWGFPIQNLAVQQDVENVFNLINQRTTLLSYDPASAVWKPRPANKYK